MIELSINKPATPPTVPPTMAPTGVEASLDDAAGADVDEVDGRTNDEVLTDGLLSTLLCGGS